MATSTADAPTAGEASTNGAGLTPAQILQAKHEAAEHTKHIPAEFHKASVEEIVDEADQGVGKEHPLTPLFPGPTGPSDANGASTPDGAPTGLSEKAKGKRKAQDGPVKPNVLDTQSEELFPALGSGPKPRAPTGPGAWNSKVAQGPRVASSKPANGVPPVSSPVSSGTSTPLSGILTPITPNTSAAQRRNGPSVMSLPGKYTDELILMNSEIDKTKSIKSVLDDIRRKLRVAVTPRQTVTQNQPSVTFTASGLKDEVQQALSRISKELASKQKIKIEVPSSARMNIIGAGGKMVQAIMKRTGARIQISKDEGAPAGIEEDDGATVQVEIEGDAIATRNAQIEIQNIVDAHASKVNMRLKNIPPEFFPFLAGPHNSRINDLEQDSDLRVTIPPFDTWQHQPPPQASGPNERPNFVPHPDLHIEIAGDRSAAQQARARLERHAEYLRQQLTSREQTFLRGQHQFIVGERGMSPQDFLQETGCIVVLPPSHEDTEDITIIGPPDQIAEGLERATALAAELLSANVDPRKNITNAPHGADAHARALAQYFAERRLEEEFQRLHDAQVAFPAGSDASGSWDIFSRDKLTLPKARADLIDIIRAHPPARLTLVEVDPFFHPHLQEQCVPSVRNDFGVHMILPQNEDSDHVILVYEGPAGSSPSFQMPRQRPSDTEIAAFEEALHQARNQILSVIGDQQDIVTKSVDVPTKFHDKVRKFVSREQQSESPSSFPVRVSLGEPATTKKATRSANNATTARAASGAFLRGPGANVDDLEAKILAFLEEAERDELERGYTTTLDFPNKFNNYLIGKHGAHINELREQFDVDINVVDGGKVEVKGPKAKADGCRSHIASLAKKWEDEATYNLKIEPKFHRDLIGRKGEDVNRLQEKYNVRIQFPRSARLGDDHSVADTTSEVGGSRPARSNQAVDEVVIRGPRQGADKARNDLLELYQWLKDNSHTATVSVAKKQVPSLMGRGGTEMDRLRADTNAQIDVPNSHETSDSDARVDIKIKGSKQAVEAAKTELQKRAKVFDEIVTRTIDIDKKYHQALIGGGGSNIRRIVLEAGGPDNSAKAVKFPSREAESESIRIEGTEPVVTKIVAAIEKFVSEKANQVTETVEAPVESHRQLIGRGGETKRKLEEQFGVTVDVPKQGSGRTAVKISGPSQNVSRAKTHIGDLVKKPEGETVLVPRSVHHAVAQNGAIFRKLKNDHGVTVDHGGQKPPPRPDAAASRGRANRSAPPLITDEPDTEAFSWELVESEGASENDDNIPWILLGPSPDSVSAARAQLEAALEAASKPSATGYLILPDPKSHRLVIGPSGRHINAIRKKTGCDIQVPKAAKGAGEEAIKIVGSKAGCEEAKKMILEAVRNGEVY